MPEIVEAILNGEWREILVGWEVESNHEGYDVEMIYGSKFDKVGGYTTWAVKRIQQHKAFLYQDDPGWGIEKEEWEPSLSEPV